MSESEPRKQRPTVQDVIRQMVAISGNTITQTSRNIGRSDRYLSSMLANKTMPSVELFAKIAGACGFGLFAVKIDDEEEDENSSESEQKEPLMLEVCGEESLQAYATALVNKGVADTLDDVNEALDANHSVLANREIADNLSHILRQLMNFRNERGIQAEPSTQDNLVQQLLDIMEPYTTKSED